MVPVVESNGSIPQSSSPPNVLPMDFPSWTRADDSDDEPEPELRSPKLRRRGRRDGIAKENKRSTSLERSVTGLSRRNQLESRGRLRNAEPFVNGVFNALKPQEAHRGGKDSDTDSDKEKKAKQRIQPPPSQQLPPTLPLANNPPANTNINPPPSPSPSPAPSPSPSPAPSPSPSPAPPPPPPPPPASSSSKDSTPPPQPSPTSSSQADQNTADIKFSTLSPSSSITSSTRVLPSLTPIVTVPIPALTSGARKGVDFQPTPDAPKATNTSPVSPVDAISSSVNLPTSVPSPSEQFRNDHHDILHPKVEKALIAVGSIGGAIIIGFLVWLITRMYKRRRGGKRASSGSSSYPGDTAFKKPKLFVTRTLGRIPIFKNHLNDRDRGWNNLEQAGVGPFDEKAYVASSLAAQNLNNPTIVVHPSFRSDGQEVMGADPRLPKESISSLDAQYNNSLLSSGQLPNARFSDISSLSSGFGDGQFLYNTMSSGISPTNVDGPAVRATIKAPLPVAQRESIARFSMRRDTVYTEASEDSPPRFRSVNSWVNQQSSRVTRARQRDVEDMPPVPKLPPEQDFGLMMPDGEEPRRADSTL